MTWRAMILESFDPALARCLVIADPDGLLRDPEISLEMRRRGYSLLEYDDPVAFRVAYEEAYEGPLVVVLWDRTRLLETLPNDVLRRGLLRSIGLAQLFPRLHIPLLADLTTQQLDRLWPVHGQQRGTPLGEPATAEIVLQTCYGVTLAGIQTPADALALLLQLHVTDVPLPVLLGQMVLQHLQRLPALDDWPLPALLNDRIALDTFLARAWPRFLEERGHLVVPTSISGRMNEFSATYAAVPLLPFDDPRVWPSVDTLFLSGRLAPLIVPQNSRVAKPYIIGVQLEGRQRRADFARKIAERVLERFPTTDALGFAWLALAPMIGELMAAQHEHDPDLYLANTLHDVRTAFATWMQSRYTTLLSAAPIPTPQLVSHLPWWLAQERGSGRRRQALIVVDGMALDQWVAVRDAWIAQEHPWSYEERALFAWVPTLTQVSRQAIFAGAPPQTFPGSLGRTDQEVVHWRRFWGGHGLQHNAIGYMKGLHGFDPQARAEDLRQINELVDNRQIQVLGLVVDAVDKLAHAALQGEVGLMREVRAWADAGWLAQVIEVLHQADFSVTLTADHGNVAVRGIGRVDDGVLAEEAGHRVRIYRDPLLRDRILAHTPSAIAWSGSGLPSDLSVVLAPSGSAFTTAGSFLIAHGGLDLREVLVPWVILRQ